MDTQKELRKQLLNYMEGRHAHALLEDVVKGFPSSMINARPKNVPYSFWGLLEHIRITQNDIVDFVQNSDYQEKNWPKDYWPGPNQKATKKMWDKSLAAYRTDSSVFKEIIEDPKVDLFTPIGHGRGQTLFRETMLIIDHTAYHVGEFILMRRTLGIWKK